MNIKAQEREESYQLMESFMINLLCVKKNNKTKIELKSIKID